MPTKKKDEPQDHGDTFEATLAAYTAGIECLRRGDYRQAAEQFEVVKNDAHNEPEMADRAATYARICERKLAPPPDSPKDVEDMYREAVFLLNGREIDAALQVLNRALVDNPTSVDLLYVRACTWAQKGASEKAVGDLRQAMAVDPKVRFQAANDPDFERIREEPSFIDIIEPTPTGA